MNNYQTEKARKDKSYHYTLADLKKAMDNGTILEGKAVRYTEDLCLHVDLGNKLTGIIKYEESEFSYDGSPVKSIALMTKVGKIIAFKVMEIAEDESGKTQIMLSRKQAQEECKREYIDNLKPGDVIDALVTYVEFYGLFCDIGCGISALLPINNLSITRVSNPKKVLEGIRDIKAVVKGKDSHGRIILSHKELLGTWEEEASKFTEGSTVIGKVRSIQDYGVFIELTPNLAGLAENTDDIKLKPDQSVTVFIKAIIPDKMKIKLLVITGESDSDSESSNDRCPNYEYKINSGRLQHWIYSPKGCNKVIETTFEDEFKIITSEADKNRSAGE